jgi:hypothetical protein
VSLSHIDMGVFDYVDDEGYLTGETITPYTIGCILSYGTQVLAFYDDFSTKPMYKFSTGISLKGYYNDDGYDAQALLLMDAGAVFMLTDVTSIGVAFKNLNIAAEAVIAPSLNVGVAAYVFTDGVNSLKLSVDAHFQLDNTKELCFGGEYSFSEYFFLRMGYMFMPGYMTSEGYVSGLNGGLGVRVQDFRFDYAITTHGGLGINHAITLLYYFAV